MSEQPTKDDSPQNMSADEFFGVTDAEKAKAENNQRIQQMSGIVDDLNESLHNAGINMNTQNIFVQFIIQILPLPYSRKRYLQDKARRGETITITDVILGNNTIFSIIRTIVFLIVFAAMIFFFSQR